MGPRWELARDGTMYLPGRPEEPVLSITSDDQRTYTLWRADGEEWLELGEYRGIEAALFAATLAWRQISDPNWIR